MTMTMTAAAGASVIATPPPRQVSSSTLAAQTATGPAHSEEAGADLVRRGWEDLSDRQRREYQARHDREMEQYEKDQEVYKESTRAMLSGDGRERENERGCVPATGDETEDYDEDDEDDVEIGGVDADADDDDDDADDDDNDDDDDVEDHAGNAPQRPGAAAKYDDRP